MVNSAARELVEQTLSAGKPVSFTVPTGSMLPFLAPGDQVIVQAVNASELKVGDLIVWKAQTTGEFQSPWIVHRLIERRRVDGESILITQGDNAPFADKPVTEMQLCGVVASVQRRNSKQVVQMLSGRARWFGVILAMMSRARAFVQCNMNELAQRIVVKGLCVAQFCFGKIAREMAG
ncbi:MAG: signal peptidase I [Chloroflexi bacterium]|nr:signal peptidase I [Chloroflexota bacterium]